MKDYNDGRIQVQDKRDDATDVLQPVNGSRLPHLSKMCKNHQCTAEDDMGFGLQDDKRKIRLTKRGYVVLIVAVIILIAFGIVDGSIMEYPEKTDVTNENPYNPLLQAGRYTNYQNLHPEATAMPKWLAELEVT